MLVQFSIHEGILDQCLTVIENTINLNGGDVLSKCGELALLNGADFAFGVEHIDVDALNTEGTVGNCATCVARSSHEDVDF